MTPTTARRSRTARTRSSIPRRMSGPVARSGAVALPAPRRGSTGLFERLSRLPDHRVVDRLLRSRLWIWVIGLALGGIVAMQVSLLKLNTGISRAVEASATLERQNAGLESEIAKMSSGERIQESARRTGMVEPPAGSVGYLKIRPGIDARRAARMMKPPSAEAQALMNQAGPLAQALPGANGAGPGAQGAAPTTQGAEPGTTAAQGTTPGATGTQGATNGTGPGAQGVTPGSTGAQGTTTGANGAQGAGPGTTPGATGTTPGTTGAQGATGAQGTTPDQTGAAAGPQTATNGGTQATGAQTTTTGG
jgi:cell division protein FtsB